MYVIVFVIIVLNIYGIVWFLTPPKPELAPDLPPLQEDKPKNKLQEDRPRNKEPMPKRPLSVEVTVATHEAGHTVVAWWCSGVVSVPSATIEAKDGGLTFIQYALGFCNPWCLMAIDLAGLAAESYALKKPVRSILSEDDLTRALHRVHDAKHIPCPWKFTDGPSLPFDKMFPNISTDEVAILKQAYVKARQLIEKHSIEYYKLVSMLLQKKTVSEADVAKILGSRGRIALYGQLAREAKFL